MIAINANKGSVNLSEGDYHTNTPILIKTGAILKGQGKTKTTIYARASDGVATSNATTYEHSYVIRDFKVVGSNGGDMNVTSPAYHGINLSDDWNGFNFLVENIDINNFTGSGLYEEIDSLFNFSYAVKGVTSGSNSRNAFDVHGGNTVSFSNCYASTVKDGKVGYRFRGDVTMTACNGTNSGSIWGEFGSLIGSVKGISYGTYTFIGCNFESIDSIGLNFISPPRNVTITNCKFDLKAGSWAGVAVGDGTGTPGNGQLGGLTFLGNVIFSGGEYFCRGRGSAHFLATSNASGTAPETITTRDDGVSLNYTNHRIKYLQLEYANNGPLASQMWTRKGRVDHLGIGEWNPASGNTLQVTGTSLFRGLSTFNNDATIDNLTGDGQLNIKSILTGSSFLSRVNLFRAGTLAGTSLQSWRNTAIGGVGMSIMTTANNAAEGSGTLTERVRYWQSGETTFGSSFTAPAAFVDIQGTAKIGGSLNMSSQKITSLATPTDATDAVNKDYVDGVFSGPSSWSVSGANIYRATGTVAIGTSTPTTAELEIHDAASNAELNLTSGLTGSTFSSRLGFRRTGVTAGSALQSYRNAAIGGVGISMMTTPNNAAEASGALTETVRYWNTGEMTIGTSLTTPAAKLDVQGTGKFSGQVNMTSQKITNLATPTATTDAANKSYVDAQVIAGADGNGIEDGGTVLIPVGSQTQGYTWPSGAAFDNREYYGDLVSGSFRNDKYKLGANNVGYELQMRLNSSGVLVSAPFVRITDAQFSTGKLWGDRLTFDTPVNDWELLMDLTKPTIGNGTGTVYQVFQDARPTVPSTQVTGADGNTTWQALGTTSYILNRDIENNSTSIDSALFNIPVVSGRTYAGSVTLWWAPVEGESIKLSLTPSTGTIDGDWIDNRQTSSLSADNEMTITDYAASGKSSTTIQYSFTASTTATVEVGFRKAATGTGFSHEFYPGTRLVVDSVKN
jgi:hypothetical protein